MTKWIELLVTYDEIEAQIVKDILEAEGIQVTINSLKISPYPVSIGKMGEVRVRVKEEDLKKAKAILKTFEDSPPSDESDEY